MFETIITLCGLSICAFGLFFSLAVMAWLLWKGAQNAWCAFAAENGLTYQTRMLLFPEATGILAKRVLTMEAVDKYMVFPFSVRTKLAVKVGNLERASFILLSGTMGGKITKFLGGTRAILDHPEFDSNYSLQCNPSELGKKLFLRPSVLAALSGKRDLTIMLADDSLCVYRFGAIRDGAELADLSRMLCTIADALEQKA